MTANDDPAPLNQLNNGGANAAGPTGHPDLPDAFIGVRNLWVCDLWLERGRFFLKAEDDERTAITTCLASNTALLKHLERLLTTFPAPHAVVQLWWYLAQPASDPLLDKPLVHPGHLASLQHALETLLFGITAPIAPFDILSRPEVVLLHPKATPGQLVIHYLAISSRSRYPEGMEMDKIPRELSAAKAPTDASSATSSLEATLNAPFTDDLGSFSAERSYALRQTSTPPLQAEARERATFFGTALTCSLHDFEQQVLEVIKGVPPHAAPLIETQARRSILLLAYREWVDAGAIQTLAAVRYCLASAALHCRDNAT